MMKVVTLSEKKFADACRRLADKVSGSGFDFDILIGIASGGWYVAQQIPAQVRLSVTLRRTSTKAKKKLLPSLLRHLPRPVCDVLRVAESRFYGLATHIRKPRIARVSLSPDVLDALHRHAGSRILIVDDAVDSGATLLAVREAVCEALPGNDIRTAVITVTRGHALIQPDYTLYPTGTIVRFPWAPDS